MVSPFSYGGQKKTGGFCLFLSVNTCPTQLAMPGVYILGVQDFFSHICLPDRRSILLFWEQTGRQALLVCVFYSILYFFFFWEASGVNFRALIDWAKASILMIDGRRCDGSDISFPFLSLGFAVNVFFFLFFWRWCFSFFDELACWFTFSLIERMLGFLFFFYFPCMNRFELC